MTKSDFGEFADSRTRKRKVADVSKTSGVLDRRVAHHFSKGAKRADKRVSLNPSRTEPQWAAPAKKGEFEVMEEAEEESPDVRALLSKAHGAKDPKVRKELFQQAVDRQKIIRHERKVEKARQDDILDELNADLDGLLPRLELRPRGANTLPTPSAPEPPIATAGEQPVVPPATAPADKIYKEAERLAAMFSASRRVVPRQMGVMPEPAPEKDPRPALERAAAVLKIAVAKIPARAAALSLPEKQGDRPSQEDLLVLRHLARLEGEAAVIGIPLRQLRHYTAVWLEAACAALRADPLRKGWGPVVRWLLACDFLLSGSRGIFSPTFFAALPLVVRLTAVDPGMTEVLGLYEQLALNLDASYIPFQGILEALGSDRKMLPPGFRKTLEGLCSQPRNPVVLSVAPGIELLTPKVADLPDRRRKRRE